MGESIIKTGTFQKVEATERTAKATGRKFTTYALVLDGQPLALGFNTESLDASKAVPGDTVRVVVSKNEKGHFQVDSVEMLTKGPVVTTAPATKPVVSHGTGVDYTQVDRRAALTLAVDMVNAHYATKEKSATCAKRFEEVIAYADFFVRYIQTGTVEMNTEDQEKLKQEGVV